jgi:hypothetical protein
MPSLDPQSILCGLTAMNRMAGPRLLLTSSTSTSGHSAMTGPIEVELALIDPQGALASTLRTDQTKAPVTR